MRGAREPVVQTQGPIANVVCAYGVHGLVGSSLAQWPILFACLRLVDMVLSRGVEDSPAAQHKPGVRELWLAKDGFSLWFLIIPR